VARLFLFRVSFVYVIFEDGTDIYWARSRVLEYLNPVTQRLPNGVTPTLDLMLRASAGSINTSCSPRIVRSPSCGQFKTGTALRPRQGGGRG